jgi:glycosyltransferase involved in cell wall biosynthesis
MIVVRNEKDYIEKSLNSLLSQTYPEDLTEILLIDGMSTDGTREWLQNRVERLKNKGVNIKLFDNPGKILAAGWNIGIRNAKGDIVCRIDAHSEIYPDYIEKGVKTLLEMKNKKVVCVGGVLEHVGDGIIGKAIANLFSSSFAVGNSPFRTNSDFKARFASPEFTDTAVYGLYWKRIFEEVGYFDESLERNQDIALHSKILERDYKFVTNPEMRIKYYARNTIWKLLKKAFNDGYWVVFLKRSFLRHRIPMFFVLYLFLIILLGVFWITFKLPLLFYFMYLVPLFVYLLGVIYFSVKDGKSYSKILLLILFPLFHISYGLGTIKGLFDKFTGKFKIRN